MKLLVLDIETVPNLARVWGLWDQNIPLSMLEDPGDLLCFAAKWHGERKVRFVKGDDMVNTAWALLHDADAVIHYNGKKFDIPWLNTKFSEAGLPRPSPYKQIDLLQTVRSNFKLPSYKLQYVAQWLKIPGKEDTGGYDTWRGCLLGEDPAWRKMRKYNVQDVRLTEQVYDRLLPWINNHPNRLLYGESGCPTCGGRDLIRRGFATTATSRYQQYQCTACGKYFRDTSRDYGVNITESK